MSRQPVKMQFIEADCFDHPKKKQSLAKEEFEVNKPEKQSYNRIVKQTSWTNKDIKKFQTNKVNYTPKFYNIDWEMLEFYQMIIHMNI